MEKETLIQIRVSEDEKKTWREAAEATGVSLSQWMRWALNEEADEAASARQRGGESATEKPVAGEVKPATVAAAGVVQENEPKARPPVPRRPTEPQAPTVEERSPAPFGDFLKNRLPKLGDPITKGPAKAEKVEQPSLSETLRAMRERNADER